MPPPSTITAEQATQRAQLLRNVAIIAHVDHGKTTLVDQLLKQSGNFRAGELEKLEGGQHGLIMDSNPLERERGITILSKNCAVNYVRPASGGGVEQFFINIIDTPGHADFGGEVERVLRMADGCLLLVDASEGAMPQTRFVLSKAIEFGLKPIVIVNKCDRPDARIDEVINEVFDLLVELGMDDEHAMDFPRVFASGRAGWSTMDIEAAKTAAGQDALPGHPEANLRPIFDAIVQHVPPPEADAAGPLQMLITTLDYNDYVGRIGIGRVFHGQISSGQQVAVMKMDGKIVSTRVQKLLRFAGLGRAETDTVTAGDICALVGLESVDIGDTIADPENPKALPPVKVDEPTLTMAFRVNDSPFAGIEGTFVTSRQIRDRLEKELQHNVALRVDFSNSAGDEFNVSGRGLLHLGILLETMRREGFELAVGKPEVVIKEIDGVQHEPIEWLVVDCPNSAVGPVMELVGGRKGEIKSMEPRGDAGTHLEFEIPARGLIGLRSRILTATQGEAILHHTFERFAPVSGETPHRLQGVLVSLETAPVTHHACELLADRGVLFVTPGDKVYAGQIVGEHNRDNDLVVNITRLKHLTNMRQANKEQTVVLKAARKMSLEACLEYIEDDELVEITPQSVRIRKRILDESMRKRAERQSRDREEARV
ncbi:MAG TPA: translational GTPase TypA [Phycisphaerales bacterium]|jgi:GTP-binding protein|nr:translational GTPase TypA [Phycisphaerales bacterium]